LFACTAAVIERFELGEGDLGLATDECGIGQKDLADLEVHVASCEDRRDLIEEVRLVRGFEHRKQAEHRSSV